MSKKLSFRRFEIWIANLEPGNFSEAGKIRPVVIVQSDLLNESNHNSTIICPISSQERYFKGKLRVYIQASIENGLIKDSYILSDQIRSIDTSRLMEKVGFMDPITSEKLLAGIKISLDF